MAKITFILDDGEKIEVPLSGPLTIGRIDGNDIVVDDPRISGQHAELRRLDGGNFEVRNLSSEGGTFVNGERVELRKLAHGDKVAFGPLNAEFQLDDVEPAVSAPATPDKATAGGKEKERDRANGQAATPEAKKGKDGSGNSNNVEGGNVPAGGKEAAAKEPVAKAEPQAQATKKEGAAKEGPQVPATASKEAAAKEGPRAPATARDSSVTEKKAPGGMDQAPAAARKATARVETLASPTAKEGGAKAAPQAPATSKETPAKAEPKALSTGKEVTAKAETPAPATAKDAPVTDKKASALGPSTSEKSAVAASPSAPTTAKPDVPTGRPAGKQEQERASAAIADVGPKPAVQGLSPAISSSEDEPRLVADPFARLEADVQEDIEKLKEIRRQHEEERAKLDADVAKFRAELATMKQEYAALSQSCLDTKGNFVNEERRLHNLRAQIAAGEERYRDISGQIHSGTERIAALKAEEKRLSHLHEEVKDAESKHGEWLAAIDALKADLEAKQREWLAESDAQRTDNEARQAEWLAAINALKADHEGKTAEVQRLTVGSENALRELEALTANKEQMGVQLLTMLREREGHEATLAQLRKQLSDVEARHQNVQQLSDAREDQVKTAERKLHTLDQQRQTAEQRLKELTDTEAKLKLARSNLQESEANQAALTAALAILATRQKSNEDQVQALDKRLLELRQEQTTAENRVAEALKELASGERALEEFRARSFATQKQLEAATEQAQAQLSARQTALSIETEHLNEARTERAELERQCQALANTESKLAEAKAGLQNVGAQRVELDAWLKVLEAKRVGLQDVVDTLHQDEEATKGRVEVLHGREKDLRAQLEELGQHESGERRRFEEIRRLAVEAEKDHKGRMEELQATIDLTRRELADMEMKLAPLREWKDAMDKRYTRLASLPEDSAEARELFKEIEAEKAALRNFVSLPAGGTREITLAESALRGMHPSEGESVPAEGDESKSQSGKSAKGVGKLHAPEEIFDPETPQERAHVGTTGTGAMLSGAGQEMALRARLTRIRESVQREATRLEFLRQERAREETRGKAGTTAGDAMLKEHERQLETKVRREEEKLAALERKLENAAMEEEKRRERLAEMERKLTELRADIAEHERVRSDSVHAAELARKELSGLEETVDRLRTMGDGGVFDGTKSGPVPMGSPKTGPVTTVGGSKLKTLVSGRTDA